MTSSSLSNPPPPRAAAQTIDKLPSHLSLITKTGLINASVHHRVKARKLHTDPCLCDGQYPQYILTKAAELNNCNETFETKYYPLYDKILNYWFPPAEGYDICPHWLIPGYEGSKDNMIAFVIEHHQHPLLLIDIQPPSEFQQSSMRSLAISYAICHLDVIGPTNLHADRLYAISAIGKRWRACYTLKGNGTERGQCVKGIAESNSLISGHPKCWNPDITSNTSWAALQSIVKTIKGYVV